MNRFHNVQNKEYIDPFQPLPLEAIQGYMVNKQAGYDKAEEALNSMNEAFLGIKPGMFTKDQYYKDYVNKYNPEIEEMTNLILQDPNSAGRIASKVKSLQTQLANDPLAKAINQDYLYTQELAKKTVGSTDKYVYRNTKPLGYDSMGNPIIPTPELYGIAKDEDVIGTLAKEIKEVIRPTIRKTKDNRYEISSYNTKTGQFDFVKVTTEKEAESIAREKIEDYANSRRNSLEEDLFFNYATRADEEGNRDLISDKAFRDKVWSEMVSPLGLMEYSKVTDNTSYDDLNKAANAANNTKGNPTKKEKDDINVKTTVAVGGVNKLNIFELDGTSNNPIRSPEDAVTSINNIKDTQKGLVNRINNIFMELAAKNNISPEQIQPLIGMSQSPEDYIKLSNELFVTGEDDTFTAINPEFKFLAENKEFKDAITTLKNLQTSKIKAQGFKADMERIGLPKLDDATKEEYAAKEKAAQIWVDNRYGDAFSTYMKNKFGVDFTLKVISFDGHIEERYKTSKMLLEKGGLNPSAKMENENFIQWYEKERPKEINEQFVKSLGDNSPMKKYYDKWNEVVDKKYNQQLIDVSSPEADKLKKYIINDLGNASKTFKFLDSDELLNDNERQEILSKLPRKSEDGAIDESQINFGITYDPKDKLVGVLTTPLGNIEISANDYNIRELAQYLAPEEKEVIDFYINHASNLYDNPGSEQDVSIGPYNFKATYSPSEDNFKWVDENGNINHTPDLANVILHYTKLSETFNNQKKVLINSQINAINLLKSNILKNDKLSDVDKKSQIEKLDDKIVEVTSKIEKYKPEDLKKVTQTQQGSSLGLF